MAVAPEIQTSEDIVEKQVAFHRIHLASNRTQGFGAVVLTGRVIRLVDQDRRKPVTAAVQGMMEQAIFGQETPFGTSRIFHQLGSAELDGREKEAVARMRHRDLDLAADVAKTAQRRAQEGLNPGAQDNLILGDSNSTALQKILDHRLPGFGLQSRCRTLSRVPKSVAETKRGNPF